MTRPVPVEALERFCREALRRCGMSEADARVTTDVLVTTDTFGIFTHGVKSLPGYVRRLRAGGLCAGARPAIESQGPAWARVNGGSAIGMITSVMAMNLAMEKARSAGVAYVGVRNSCHFGAAGYYALLAAKADMIGMAMANDCPSMAVPGSRGAVLGTNPFAYAVPAGEEDPIFFDVASSAVAGGKIRIAQSMGQEVPLGWLVDADGVPTTDPNVYPHHGALLPFAGHKGYGFATMIESLSAILTGAASTWAVGSWLDSDPALSTNHGAAFLAFNVGAMAPIAEFRTRMDKLIREVRQTPKAKGRERVYVPGELEWERRRGVIASGEMAMPDDVLAGLRSLATDVDVKADWLQA